MNKKQIYVVNVKMQFNDETQEIIPFYIEADTMGKAETKTEKWLYSGLSGFKFTEILSIEADHNIWVIE
jgi:hypothetical protein